MTIGERTGATPEMVREELAELETYYRARKRHLRGFLKVLEHEEEEKEEWGKNEETDYD